MKTLYVPRRVPLDDAPEVLTLNEAGRRAGRSYSWARDQVIRGALDAHKPAVGPTLVTAESLRVLLASRRCRRHGGPKLAWTNPNL